MGGDRLPPAAERLRRHREEMELALRENLTLDQARTRLAAYREQLPRLDADDRLLAIAPARLELVEQSDERPLPWWIRD